MPKRKFFWTSDGRPHSYGSPVAGRCLGLRPRNELMTAKVRPRNGAETDEDERWQVAADHD